MISRLRCGALYPFTTGDTGVSQRTRGNFFTDLASCEWTGENVLSSPISSIFSEFSSGAFFPIWDMFTSWYCTPPSPPCLFESWGEREITAKSLDLKGLEVKYL